MTLEPGRAYVAPGDFHLTLAREGVRSERRSDPDAHVTADTQVLLLDMAVAVLISATLFCFILALDEPAGPKRRGLFYGLYVAAALATLAKGLIGFLLPGAVMFLWLLAFNQWHRLRPLYLPSGVLVFLVVAAPWRLLAAQRNPGWAQDLRGTWM